jgi:adenine phosphoribosyltransferase
MEGLLREVKDFPRAGITFYDIDPLLNNSGAFRSAIDALVAPWIIGQNDADWSEAVKHRQVDVVAGPEARGYIFASAMAYSLGAGVALVRKPGKLPAEKISQDYGLEYGKNTVEMHTTAIKPGQKVLIVDDLLATGGTIEATVKLVERLGGSVIGVACLVELSGLGGRELIEGKGIRVHAVIKK